MTKQAPVVPSTIGSAIAWAYRTALIIGSGLLVYAIYVASLAQPIFEAFAEVMANPWGAVAIYDLYLGFLLFAGIIFLLEERKWIAFLWTIALCTLGNPIACFWLLLNFNRLKTRLSAAV